MKTLLTQWPKMSTSLPLVFMGAPAVEGIDLFKMAGRRT